jgi:CheY-like chemotaxis protein
MDEGTLHILVIDDDEGMRHLLFELLAPLGHQIIMARSAEEGLAQLPYYTFDAAFLDHNLPGMEGLVLGEYLKKNNPDLKIALVTGDTSPRLERLCREYDITFIGKPFERSEVVSVVEEAEREAVLEHVAAEQALSPSPAISEYFEALPDIFALPSLPQRIQDQLGWHIQEALTRMRLHGPSEGDRVIAYSALLSARVLGVRLSKMRQGKTLWEEYDDLVESWGCKPSFRSEAV